MVFESVGGVWLNEKTGSVVDSGSIRQGDIESHSTRYVDIEPHYSEGLESAICKIEVVSLCVLTSNTLCDTGGVVAPTGVGLFWWSVGCCTEEKTIIVGRLSQSDSIRACWSIEISFKHYNVI